MKFRTTFHKAVCTLCICCVVYNLTLCQSKNNKIGYIIYLNGDTVYGNIKSQAPIQHSEYILFQETGSNEHIKYYPEQIAKYYFEASNYYQVESIPFRSWLNDINYRKLFVKKLVEGEIELYRLDHQLTENPSPAYEYQTKFYFFRINGTETLIDLNEDNYLSKIHDAFNKKECQLACDSRTGFNDEALSNLFTDINSCIGSPSKNLYEPKTKQKINLGISLGIASANIHTPNIAFDGFTMNQGTGYDINLFINQKILNRISLRGGVSFKHRNQDGYSYYVVPEFYLNYGDTVDLNSNITLNQLFFPAHIIYNFSKGKINPYIFTGGYFGVGIENSAYLDKYKFVPEGTGNRIVTYRTMPFTASISAFELGWVVGGGIEYFIHKTQTAFIEVQYVNGRNDIPPDMSLHVSEESILFLIGFTF